LIGIWKQLGIEATNDIKQIKKAYAKKLKLVRPDEKPKEFQQLHQSYKTALEQAKRNSRQPEQAKQISEYELNSVNISYGNEDIVNDINKNEQNLEIVDASSVEMQPAESTVIPVQNDYQPEIERMMVKVENAISKDTKFEPESWTFVITSQYILDYEFVYLFGFALFKRIAKYYNDKQYRQDGDYQITASVLQYLDSIFHWTDSDISIPDYITDKYGLLVFERIKQHKLEYKTRRNASVDGVRGAKSIKKVDSKNYSPLKTYYYGGGVKRIIAMILDSIVFFPLIVLFRLFNENVVNLNFFNYKDFEMMVYLVVFFMGTWLFETSRFQATPGKLAMGLRVITKNQERLSYPHGFLRVCIFLITSLGFYLTIIINSWLSGNYIHDRMTRSHVMDLSRSRREQRKRKRG